MPTPRGRSYSGASLNQSPRKRHQTHVPRSKLYLPTERRFIGPFLMSNAPADDINRFPSHQDAHRQTTIHPKTTPCHPAKTQICTATLNPAPSCPHGPLPRAHASARKQCTCWHIASETTPRPGSGGGGSGVIGAKQGRRETGDGPGRPRFNMHRAGPPIIP